MSSLAREVKWEEWVKENPVAAIQLERIAAQELHLDILATRNLDSLDFSEQAVWSIAKALMLAFRAGQQSGRWKKVK